MEIINWQGPFKFDNLNLISLKNGIYIHSLETKLERIWYIGKGRIRERQIVWNREFNNPNHSTILVDKLQDKDFYDFCTHDRCNKNEYIFLDPDKIEYKEFRRILGNSFNNFIKENNTRLKQMTNIYFAEIENDKISLITECNIQYLLIKEFKLDVYEDFNYRVGFCPQYSGNLDTTLIIQNNYDQISDGKKMFFHEHFRKCVNGIIDLSNESDNDIRSIKEKLFL